MDDVHMQDVSMHALYDMTGLVMGIHILPSKAQLNKDDKPPPDERHLTLIAREENNSKGFVLIDHNIPSNSGNIIVPGPPIVLTKDQPVSIKIINKLNEPTSLHWHGLEVESYYDGVAGWSNRGNELAPLIMPNDSFVVHILPNRAGTFIYHTHMTNSQVASGMYGALIVVDAGKKFDTAKDKVLFISTGGNDLNSSAVLLNGSQHPAAMLLKINQPYRFRIIDLNTITGYHAVSLLFKNKPVNWKAVAKDAVMLPPKEALMYKAFKQKIATGETRDFEFAPDKKGDYIFEVKNKDDKVVVKMVMNVR